MAALVLDRKPLRQGLGRQSPAVNIREQTDSKSPLAMRAPPVAETTTLR
jgi:hypothetical protein